MSKHDRPIIERRMQLELRASIDNRLKNGWSIERSKNGYKLIPPKHLRLV